MTCNSLFRLQHLFLDYNPPESSIWTRFEGEKVSGRLENQVLTQKKSSESSNKNQPMDCSIGLFVEDWIRETLADQPALLGASQY